MALWCFRSCHTHHPLISPNLALITSVQERIITYSLFPALCITLITDKRPWKQQRQTVSCFLLSELISHITPDPVKYISKTKQSMIKLRLASDSIRSLLVLYTKVAESECGYRWVTVQSVSLCLVISKLCPKEMHIAFYISKEITLQYVAMVLCQEKSQSFLLPLSEAGLHGAPV